MMNVGWIGTGKLGLPMAARIAASGTGVRAYVRSPERVEAIRARQLVCVSIEFLFFWLIYELIGGLISGLLSGFVGGFTDRVMVDKASPTQGSSCRGKNLLLYSSLLG
jgi:hypothetical protein